MSDWPGGWYRPETGQRGAGQGSYAALAFVRDRHSFADEDLQREQDQRAFLKALLDRATSPGVYLNPFTALKNNPQVPASMLSGTTVG